MKRIYLAVVLASVMWWGACTVPAWVNTVLADAQTAAPIAGSLVEVIDPALAPLVMVIENGFTALVNTINIYKSHPTATNLQAVQAAFQAVDANVAQLESAAQIKNAATQAKVTAIVQLLAQVVTEIGAQVPPSSGLGTRGSGLAVKSSAPHALAAKGWNASEIKKQYNAIVQGDPRFKELK